MGAKILEEQFTPEAFQAYGIKLKENLVTLENLLQQETFGKGPLTLGAELELSVVNHNFDAAYLNKEIMATANDPHIQAELNQFNLEYNFDPVEFQGSCFGHIKKQMHLAEKKLTEAAHKNNAELITIGILPTLTLQDLDEPVMTPIPRYKILSETIKKMHGGPFVIDINGEEPLKFESDALTLEGGNTSMQAHMKVPPNEFKDLYNAVQVATPLALAVSANSPTLLGHSLWDETRIPLFKQAVECRQYANPKNWREPSRVNYGYGWIRENAFEYFAELVSLFPPIFPIVESEEEKKKKKGAPNLLELCLHQGAVWKWNRAIYDPTANGHLRIEMRTLPSGPTIDDMLANMAFLIGLSHGLKQEMHNFLPAFPFMFAEYNFYQAAEKGLNARLVWPGGSGRTDELSVKDLIKRYLPYAKSGLESLLVDEREIAYYLEIIKNRVENGQNGADWQRKSIKKHEKNNSRNDALHLMLSDYKKNQRIGLPVSEWSI